MRSAAWVWPLAVLLTSCGPCASDAPRGVPVAPPKASDAPKPTSKRVPVIDAHTHIGKKSYDLALRLADENGVQRIVNLSGGHQGKKGAIEHHVKAMKQYPGRIAVFYNVAWGMFGEPEFGKIIADGLEEAVGVGYGGLKIAKSLGLGVTNPDGSYVPVDDPRLDPIWARAGALGVPVSIHTGDPKAFFEPTGPDNERIEELSEAPHWSFADPKYPRREALLAQRERVLKKHPGTTFILVHFGNNPEDIDDIDRLLDAHPNAFVDLSARIGEVGRHDPAKVRALFIKHKTRILFGTDLGVHSESKDGQRFVSLFLGSISKEPPSMASVGAFFGHHWRFLEDDPAKTPDIPHPIPIQGPWPVHPIHLPADVLQAVYHDNAKRLIFDPLWARLGIPDPLQAPKKGDGADASP